MIQMTYPGQITSQRFELRLHQPNTFPFPFHFINYHPQGTSKQGTLSYVSDQCVLNRHTLGWKYVLPSAFKT